MSANSTSSGSYTCTSAGKQFVGTLYRIDTVNCFDPDYGMTVSQGGFVAGPVPTKPVPIDNSYGCGRLQCNGRGGTVSTLVCNPNTGNFSIGTTYTGVYGCTAGWINVTW